MPLGNLVIGEMIPLFSVSVTMAGSGLILTGLGLYFLLVHRRVASL
jgi:hypothetical protein